MRFVIIVIKICYSGGGLFGFKGPAHERRLRNKELGTAQALHIKTISVGLDCTSKSPPM